MSMTNIAKKRIILKLIIFLAICLFLGVIARQEEQKSNNLKVTFFDVGQGDSIFIQMPGNQQILIDGGPDTGILNKLGRAMPFYDHTIELMVLTHSHADHVIGLLEVLKRYKVERIIYTGVKDDSPLSQEWLRLIKDEGAEIILAQGGQTFTFGKTQLEILYPFNNISGQAFKDLNSSSIVSRLTYQNTTMLFMGDASAEVEQQLIKYQTVALPAEVLKVGHHGSRYSSSPDFLQAVKPKYAVIQSGQDNKFGHPHKITLKNLENIGSTILRNDKSGDIKIISAGQSAKVNK